MLYILWALLNLVLAAGLLFVCYRIFKRLRLGFGWAAALLLVLCFLSFTSSNDSKDTDLLVWKANDATIKNAVYKRTRCIVLSGNPLFKINLSVAYGFDRPTGAVIPLHACSSVEGTMAGIAWKAFEPSVYAGVSGKKINYDITGTMEWKLLNIGSYHQPKSYSGEIKIQEQPIR